MLFFGSDQHARQLTVSLRDPHGDVLLASQISPQRPNVPRGRGQVATDDSIRRSMQWVLSSDEKSQI